MKRIIKFKSYISERKLRKLDIIAAVLCVCAVLFIVYDSYKHDIGFNCNVELSNPYIVKTDQEGQIYILDSERTRIVKVNAAGEAAAIITSNDIEDDTISYAEDMAVGGNGDIFVLDTVWEGLYIKREAILVYDKDGKYKYTCYNAEYDPDKIYVDKHKIFDMTVKGDYLYYIAAKQTAEGRDGFCAERLLIDPSLKNEEISEPEEIVFFQYNNAYDFIHDYELSLSKREVYVLDKQNNIEKFTWEEGQTTVKLAADADRAKNVIFSTLGTPFEGKTASYRITRDNAGLIYFTDILSNRIIRVDPLTKESDIIIDEGCEYVISLSAGEDKKGNTVLSLIYNDGICIVNEGETSLLEEKSIFQKSIGMLLSDILFNIICLMLILSALWLLIRIICGLAGMKFTILQKVSFIIVFTVFVVAIIITGQLLSQFREIYLEEMFDKLYVSAHTAANQLNTDYIERINKPEDYMNEDYTNLMSELDSIFTKDIKYSREIYCVLLKYDENAIGTKSYNIAYLDKSIGAYYPLDEEETAEAKEVYETGEDVYNDGKDNVAGSFIYIKVPIKNAEDKVAAIVEIGTEVVFVNSRLSDMQQKIIITLVMILLIVMFLFAEGFSLFNLRDKFIKRKSQDGTAAIPMHMLRVIIFITFMSFNLATSFLPVFILKEAGQQLGMSQELTASLPITLNLFFVGLMSLFCAKLIKRFSFKNIAICSVLISFAGDIIVLTQNKSFYLIVLGLILNGIGVGLITNAINMYIASINDKSTQNEGFSIFNSGSLSGINCGMIFGAFIAGALGQRAVFGFSALAWLIVCVMLMFIVKYIGKDKPAIESQGIRLLFSKNIIGYILLIQIPFTILNSFVFYYVPIFGDGQGMDEIKICLLLMINSLFSVYLSTVLTNYTIKKFKNNCLYISLAVNLGAILIFALYLTVPSLIISLILIGIARSFGTPARNVYYMELPEVKQYGEERSIGIYNFTDNVSESVGPIIFSNLMAVKDVFLGACQFAAVIAGTGILYIAAKFSKNKK